MLRPSRLLPFLLVAAFSAAGVAQASPVRTGTGSGRRTFVQRAAAVPAGASVTGSVAQSEPIRVTLALAPSDAQALQSYAQDVSDPSSPLYRQYLTVGQFAARFGADASELSSVRSALTEAGLSVGAVSANGLSVSASGTAAEVEGAFDTQLEQVTLPGGSVAYADITNPTLPPAAADAVQSVAGLDSLPAAAPQGLRRAHGEVRTGRATGDGATGAGTTGACIAEQTADGYTAAEIGSAYGLDGQWDDDNLGAGSTVALVELEPYLSSDVAGYQACDDTSAAVTNINVDGGSANCWQHGPHYDVNCGVEDVLDIEDVAGLAPDATIDVYEGPNTDSGLLDVYQSIVDADAPVISTSWGECEADAGSSMLTAENALFEEAAVQGEAVFAAAGDDGADDCGGAATVDDPASQPYVTGVGGTTLPSDTPGATETVWNEAGGAGGGGVSSEWAAPSYQSGVAIAQSAVSCAASPGSASTSTNCREVPDVSADADPATGYDIFWNGKWQVEGGTSAAAPTWASLVALADSSNACTSDGVRVGFANAVLYGLPSSDFNDVTSGTNTYDGVTGYSAGAGYDMASGRGTPDGAALIPALCSSPTTITAQRATTTSVTSTVTTPVQTTTTVQTTTAPVRTTTAPVQTTTTRPGGTEDAVRFLTRATRRSVCLGHRVRLVLRAHDRAGLRLRYTAQRLPRGLRINRSSGVISGRPTRLGRDASSITARDAQGDAQTIVIRWTITRR